VQRVRPVVVVLIACAAAFGCLPQNDGGNPPSPPAQPPPTPPSSGDDSSVVDELGDPTFYSGFELDNDTARDNPELATEGAPPLVDDPIDPSLPYLEPPWIDCYDRVDQGLPDDSNTDPADIATSCTCQPPANPGACDYSTVGWYQGWCTSLCTYASACLCTQPDPWNPNQCDGWSDEWSLNGCPGPNPCICQ
jgi:hypothetical protein